MTGLGEHPQGQPLEATTLLRRRLPPAVARSSEHSLAPRTGNRERDSRRLNVDEQPLAVRAECGAGEFIVREVADPNRRRVVTLVRERVRIARRNDDVVARELERLPIRQKAEQ